MEIAFKILTPENGLSKRRSIDEKITIDIKNKTIIVEGHDYVYAPNGVIISQTPFRYERDNIPAISEVKDANGVVISPAVPANPRFDNYVKSPIGIGIADMIQKTIDLM